MSKTKTSKYLSKSQKNSPRRALATFTLLAVLFVNATQAYAATIAVDALDDNIIHTGNCGLRDAISSANSNLAVDGCVAGDASPVVDDIIFTAAPGTITLLNGQLPTITEGVNINGDTNGDGTPDITVDAGSTSRILEVSAPAVTVRGFNFLNGAAVGHGGTIYVHTAADLSLLNSTIASSTASVRGGAIAADSDSVVSLDHVDISNTSSTDGGAIFVDTETTNVDPDNINLSIDHSTITNSRAYPGSGGGVYLGSNNEAQIHNTIITNADAEQNGGGIYHAGETSPPPTDTQNLNLNTVRISNSDANTSLGVFKGGGMYLGPGMETVSDGNLVLDHDTAYQGGGIFVGGTGGSLHLGVSDAITYSSADKGGGVYLDTAAGLQINAALGQEAIFQNNHADTDGGALAIAPSATEVNLSRTNFLNNDSTVSGGAIFADNANLLTIGNNNFYQNFSPAGGAIATLGSPPTSVTLDIDDSHFQGNGSTTALSQGGAIFAGPRTIMNFNHLTTAVSGMAPFDNTAGQGGFLYMSNSGDNSSLTLANSDISHNNSNSLCGGAMTLASAYAPLLPPLQLTNVVMSNNVSATDGGAICLTRGSMSLDNADFSDNSAANYGGALYLSDAADNASTDITNGSDFTNNAITSHKGAAIANVQTGVNTTTLTITGSTFAVALPALSLIEAGSAIYNQGGSTSITGSTFTSNDAAHATDGGAIYSTGGILNLTNSIISHFASISKGGAIFNDTANTATITGSTIQNNNGGGQGGAIYSNGILNILTSYLGVNQSNSGGGIYINGGDLSLRNSTIDSNDAIAGDGGGVYLGAAAGVINLISSTLAFNHASANGGGIDLLILAIGMNNTILQGNTSTTFGPNSDCSNSSGGTISTGHNLISNTTYCGTVFDPTDVLNLSATLGPLALYGGTTLNYSLLTGSPAINAGNTAELTDQRGVTRPQGPTPDIGAHEYQDSTSPVIAEVTPVPTPSTDTTPNYTFTTNEAGVITYSGGCIAPTTTAAIGPVTVTFNTLAPATYSLCTITVTDIYNNVSNLLAVTPFTITTTTAPPPLGGGSGQFGAPSCSGSACSGIPAIPPVTPPLPPVTPPIPPLPPVTPPIPPLPPVTPPTTPISTPSGSSSSSSGSSNVGRRPAAKTNLVRPTSSSLPLVTVPVVTVPVVTTPVVTIPSVTPKIPILPAASIARIDPTLAITTPDSGLKSADDTPFIMGEGAANTSTDVYLFDSTDFAEIRSALQKDIAEKNPSFTPAQRDQSFQQEFTDAVISILYKYIHNTLDPQNPTEAKFVDRVLNLGAVNTGRNGLFLLDSTTKVRDNAYLAVAYQNGASNNGAALFSKEVLFTVDSSLNVLTPEIKTLGGKSLSADALIGNLRVEIDPGNLLPTLVGNIKQPSKIVANWQSDITTSALIADSLDVQFRLSAPAPLASGDHTVYVTAYRRSDNAQSQTLKINFHVSAISPLEIINYYWWIIVLILAGGLLVIFILRRRKAPPTIGPATSSVPVPVVPTPIIPSSIIMSVSQPVIPPSDHSAQPPTSP